MSVSAIQHNELFRLISTTVRETFPSDSFVGEILDKKGITLIGKKINALSKEVPIIRNPEIYQRTKGFTPGAVIIFEVEVTLHAGELEDNTSQKKIEVSQNKIIRVQTFQLMFFKSHFNARFKLNVFLILSIKLFRHCLSSYSM